MFKVSNIKMKKNTRYLNMTYWIFKYSFIWTLPSRFYYIFHIFLITRVSWFCIRSISISEILHISLYSVWMRENKDQKTPNKDTFYAVCASLPRWLSAFSNMTFDSELLEVVECSNKKNIWDHSWYDDGTVKGKCCPKYIKR